MIEELKTMSVQDFRDLGFLQEVNRQFFHPRGMALSVIVEEDGTVSGFGDIWDYREDPEGMIYADGILSESKARLCNGLLKDKQSIRKRNFGFVVQPLPPLDEEHIRRRSVSGCPENG